MMTREAQTLDTLITTTSEEVRTLALGEVVLALGSNHDAAKHLARVHEALATLGAAHYSEAYQNPDFTASAERPKPDYVNQCVYLRLDTPQTLTALQRKFAGLESACERCRIPDTARHADKIRLVTMDIDILLIHASTPDARWQLLSNRVPLKAHERIGIDALLSYMNLQRI
ncbi:2-amino-4-hydroxy-6-hydroxymethyldihydropteridine diphosphokinase [Psychrobacter aestuarii]|uniref:2-amino-4-hydroxy-6-hydroxymethyldihydropteridine diphosphokinase n=1 Tax=Psychrobacter aestuarii TaxID=556327 RepID=A0ABP3FIV1_9GAMM|nr:2-amino-4-hydroxy-6-hydroxymethyldihydropteridine diphosphokinase [Psychrobacter aestuarii]